MTEEVNFKTNFEGFVDKVQDAFVDRIVLSLDTVPSFDKGAVPFQFDYSIFAMIDTNKGKFKIISAATTEGTDTFWIERVEEKLEGNRVIEIGSKIRSVELETASNCQYPFKISMLFDNQEIILYCAEIYEDVDGTPAYTFNDEMILVFDKKQEAIKFEKLINYG